jgi:hypothetical protein
MGLDSQITQSREPDARAGQVVPAYIGRPCGADASAQVPGVRNSVGNTAYSAGEQNPCQPQIQSCNGKVKRLRLSACCVLAQSREQNEG